MKHTIFGFVILTSLVLLFSCGESGPTEKELELQAKLDSIQALHEQDKETVEEYMSAINEIQAGLDEIKQQEKILVNRASGDNELQESDVEMINNDIETIYEMMTENKKKLNYLRSELSKAGSEMKEFKTTVEQLTAQLNEKDMEMRELQAIIQQKDVDLQQLNERLDQMALNLTQLEEETEEQAEVIEQQQDELNTAYYVIGDKSFLKDNEILTKEGGFIGMGGVQTIQKSSSEFTQIDIREVSAINLNLADKITLLTDHPQSAYTAETDADGKYTRLTITDPQAFWEKSKYLVIMTR